MPTMPVNAGAVTLVDVTKSMDPNGTVAKLAELLNQQQDILSDLVWKEGNLITGHQASIRTGLPVAVFRKMYQGVAPSKSQRQQVTDSCGYLEARSEIDKEVANLNGNTAEFRFSESLAFFEAMSQGFGQALIYGDASVNPEQFNGLAIRYNTINTNTSEVAKNVISAGGSGNCTSVWLVVSGEETVCGIYPKGTQAGLSKQDLGEFDAFDASNQRFRAVGDLFQWRVGLHVKDWRYVVRIANISIADLLAQTGTQANTAATWLPKLMVKAMARIPSMGMGRACFYASRTVKEMLAVAAIDKSSNALSIQQAVQQFGALGIAYTTQNLSILGVPIRTLDRILETESPLT